MTKLEKLSGLTIGQSVLVTKKPQPGVPYGAQFTGTIVDLESMRGNIRVCIRKPGNAFGYEYASPRECKALKA